MCMCVPVLYGFNGTYLNSLCLQLGSVVTDES